MSLKLSWFTVKLALLGVSEEYAPEVVRNLQGELNTRSHLRNPQVFLETEAHRVVIKVDIEGRNPEGAARQMAEELFEIPYGVLREIEGMHIEIIDAYPSPE